MIELAKIKNRIGDIHFRIYDKLDNNIVINFNWKCSQEKIVWGQMLFLSCDSVGGFVDSSNKVVASRCITASRIAADIQELCEYWEAHYPNKPLWNWSRENLIDFVRGKMLKSNPSNEASRTYADNRLFSLCGMIAQSHNQYLTGKLPDGAGHRPNDSFRRAVMEPLLSSQSLTYEKWMEAESFGSISLTVASLMLAKSFEIIESEHTKAASLFFSTWQKFPSSPIIWFASVGGSKHDKLQRFFMHGKDATDADKALGNIFQENNLGHLEKLPWRNVSELSAHCKLVKKACLNILLLLSGHRISELLSIRSDGYEKKGDGCLIRESIFKTLEGMEVPRFFYSVAADAIELLWRLSFVDSEKYSLPLFHRCYKSPAAFNILGGEKNVVDWLPRAAISAITLRLWFRDFFNEEIVKKFPEVAEEQASVTPHQCRHTWAEFALRRFDGNVLAKIREHFLHFGWPNSTRAYTDKKLSESVKSTLEHEYLRELIFRVLQNKFDDRFKGPAAKRIFNAMREVFALTPAEIEAKVQEIDSSIARLAVHEWGYCVLFKDSAHSAMCLDDTTALPDVDGGASSALCIFCCNGMNNDVQANYLKRIAIAHTHIAETHKIKAIGKLSLDIVNQIEKRLRK